MRSYGSALAFGAAVVSSCLLTSASADPTYITVDGSSQHGTRTQLFGINAKGEAVGVFTSGRPIGFVYKPNGTIITANRKSSTLVGINNKGETTGDLALGHLGDDYRGLIGNSKGKVTVFVVPEGKKGTYGVAINDSGEIAGAYENESDNFAGHGFVRDPSGLITTFDAPGAGSDGNLIEGTFPSAINASGFVTGSFRDSARVAHCFLRNPSGALTTFDAAGNDHGTLCNAINADGAIAGVFGDGTASHGFVRAANGTITAFDAPGAGEVPIPLSINGKGVVAGYCIDSAGPTHGFVRSAKGKVTVFDAPDFGGEATTATFAEGINDKGEIAGYFVGASNIPHGFLRFPK